MKIAIDIRTAASGEKDGKGWYTFLMVENLLKIDSENEYILYSKDQILGLDKFKNAKIKIVRGRGPIWHKRVKDDMRRETPDIFFSPTSYITPAILPQSIKKVVTVHDLVAILFPENHNKKATIIEKLFLKKAMKSAAAITTVSDNTKKDLVDIFGYDPQKIHTIYCSASEKYKPLEKESLKKFEKQTNLPGKFFLAVGTIQPRKNYQNLIIAFSSVSKMYPNHHLIIIGKKGWKYKKIEEEIQKNYLNNRIHMLGYISQKSMIKLYNLAQALIFPSLYEGFGIPLLEALKCGCPVIASGTSSIPEVVGKAAILINPKDPTRMARAMIALIKDKKLQENLKKSGFEQAKKFSWEVSAKKLLALFQSLK